MNFDEWKDSAKRMPIEDYEHGSDLQDVLEDMAPGEAEGVTEAIILGPDRSWLLVRPGVDGGRDGESYHVIAGRHAERVSDFDVAAEILWEEHAKYEQDDAPGFN